MVTITPRIVEIFERWRDNPRLRGVRISPGNSEDGPESIFIRATVKKENEQNSAHILVHDPARAKLIYQVKQVSDPSSVGHAVADLMAGKY